MAQIIKNLEGLLQKLQHTRLLAYNRIHHMSATKTFHVRWGIRKYTISSSTLLNVSGLSNWSKVDTSDVKDNSKTHTTQATKCLPKFVNCFEFLVAFDIPVKQLMHEYNWWIVDQHYFRDPRNSYNVWCHKLGY